MQELRDYYQARVTITGPNRCPKKNSETSGAAPNSMHLYGRACDFMVEGVRPAEIYAYLVMKYPNKFGIGLYHNRVHLDTRKEPARWQG